MSKFELSGVTMEPDEGKEINLGYEKKDDAEEIKLGYGEDADSITVQLENLPNEQGELSEYEEELEIAVKQQLKLQEELNLANEGITHHPNTGEIIRAPQTIQEELTKYSEKASHWRQSLRKKSQE